MMLTELPYPIASLKLETLVTRQFGDFLSII